jgi:ligand-binding SRPBCC domain-containing protein
MPHIHITTFIAAPVERVFDLSRSIGLHKRSMIRFKEQAVSGKTSGFMELGDVVTWKAKHVWKERILKVKMISYQKPHSFTDEQIQGDFKRMKHEHFFKPCNNGTIMIDQFHFKTPYGRFGEWFNKFYLINYMTQLLEERNGVIKSVAESNQWKHYLIHSHA